VIKQLDDMPAGVLGFETSGQLEAENYRDVLLPAIEQGAVDGELRVVLVIPTWDGMSGGALWQDLKMGTEHLRRWKRLALVTDLEWMIHATSLFGWMTPGQMKHFTLAERDQASAWAAG
jgi:hypothetical protein